MARLTLVAAALLSLLSAVIATFNPASSTNVAVYWGQGPNQARLVETCMNPNVDIIIIAFINVFPDQSGSGGYPGSNFGDACGSATYKNKNGGSTQLLSNCPYIGPDITTCQQQYGKKVLLSLGGGYPTNYFVAGSTQAVEFAEFLWGAFGPVTSAWTNAKNPRPFGNAVVDGFDFDIESEVSPAPTYDGKSVNNYMTSGYAKMIMYFKNQLFPTDHSKSYYISGAPQCVVPDAHLGQIVQNVWFDFIFVQFYNTASCSARAGVQHIQGKSSSDISYNTWSKIPFHNPNVKLYIGLPASTTASNDASYYLSPQDAYTLLGKYQSESHFGGVMLWEATHGANNIICGKNYQTWIKQILVAVNGRKSINVNTHSCSISKSTKGFCGPNYGTTCSGSNFGTCCGSNGRCTTSKNACASQCDSRFSTCSSKRSAQLLQIQHKRQNEESAFDSENSGNEPQNEAGSVPSSTSAQSSSTTTASTSTVAVSTATTSTVVSTTATTSNAGSSTSSDASSSTTSSTSIPTSTTVITSTPGTSASDIPPTTSSFAGFTNSSVPVNTTIPTVTPANSTASSFTASQAVVTPGNAAPTTESQSASQSESTSVIHITRTKTIYSTIYSTTTNGDSEQTIASVTPIGTSTEVVQVTGVDAQTPAQGEATPAPGTEAQTPAQGEATTQTVTTVTSCDSSDPDCTSSERTITVVITSTSHVQTTLTVPATATASSSKSTSTLTLYTTEYATAVIQQGFNTDGSLYNPHSTSAQNTSKVTLTMTVNTTVTVTPMTTTEKSTTTVVQYVTVSPVASVTGEVEAAAQKYVSVTDTDDESSAPTASASASASPVEQTTNAGGRLTARTDSSWAIAFASMAAVGAVMLLL